MRKTKLGLLLVMCATILVMVLSGCGGTGNSNAVDTAKVEKAVLSVMNKALGTEFTNDESLRSKADIIWNNVDKNGRLSLNYSMYIESEGEKGWIITPMINSESLGEDAKFPMIAFTDEMLKKYEEPTDELIAQVKQKVDVGNPTTEITSICVTARNIGGKVYVVYVRELRSK